MKKEMLTILSIVALVSIVVIIGCSKPLACTLEAKVCPDGTTVGRNPNNDCEFDPCPIVEREELSAARAPTVEVEGTVMSLYLDELYEEGELNPRDRASIKIDNIDRSNDPNNVVNLNVGEEWNIHFLYSARPAKIRRSGEGIEEVSGNMTSYTPKADEAIGIEEDYIIYETGKIEDAEIILHGLEENDIIKIKVWGGNIRGRSPNLYIEVGEYEVIP